MRDLRYLIPEKEKYNKDGSASHLIKDIFDNYINLGEQQVARKSEKYRKLKDLAIGVINKEDYIKEPELGDALEFDEKDIKADDANLSFYPLLPVVRTAILGDEDKKYSVYHAKAINPENTNDFLESLDSTLVQLMVESANNIFLSKNPNPTEEQAKLHESSLQQTDIYKKKVRTELEKWANHVIQRDDKRFDMKFIERTALDQELTTKDPTIHVEYSDGDYKTSILNESNTFYLKSKYASCYSKGMMFGVFDYLTPGAIINKHADKLTEHQVSHIENWLSEYYSTFIINDQYDSLTGNRTADQESIQNYLTFKNIEQAAHTNEAFDRNLFRETTVYALIPRKIGKLTFKSGEFIHRDLVDEYYKVTYKPKYDGLYNVKSEFTLLEGEHIEWFYRNELWIAKKLDFDYHSAYPSPTHTDDSSIWIECKKHDIQYSDQDTKYGVGIPVFGGFENTRFENNISLIERGSTWQRAFNWLWNRITQLLATEVGRFFAFNQLAIPKESMGDSWGKGNWFKWLITGRDTGFAPLDLSVNSMGQSMTQGAGLGQMVDLNRTADILEKYQLAQHIKNECYQSLGLNPEYLFGNFSPEQTATSVVQGLQRSTSQVQGLYSRIHQVMKRVRNCMLETAQFVESQKDVSEMSYMTDRGIREIFRMGTGKLLIGDFDIYVESSLSEMDVIEKIKGKARNDNTLVGSSYEAALIEESKTVNELIEKLRVLDIENKEREQQAMQMKQQEAQQALEAQQMGIEKELQYKTEKDRLDRQTDIDVAKIRAMGEAEKDAGVVAAEINKILKERHQLEKDIQELEYRSNLETEKHKQVDSKLKNDENKTILDEKIRLKQLAQKDRELDIREYEAKNTNERTDKL